MSQIIVAVVAVWLLFGNVGNVTTVLEWLIVVGLAALAIRAIVRRQASGPLPSPPSSPRPAWRPEEVAYDPIAELSDDAPPLGATTTSVRDALEAENAIRIGRDGESRVDALLGRLRLPVLSNLYLEDDAGLTQVDHVVRMPWGFVVIETKTYGGFISGTGNPKQWKQSFRQYGSDAYYLFQNPIHQNYRHLHAVRAVSGLSEHVFPMVVFAGKARTSRRVHDQIVRLNRLRDRLYTRPQVPFIAEARLDAAWGRLEAHAASNRHRELEHRAELRKRH